MLALIFLLTFAHAVLMVSSAIVISVQATTIRSANLLASFVVVPVAFLLQGETFLIFWGNEDVLWFAIAGVTLLAALLVRLGLSHFRREYMLGREIDTLNFKQIGRTFRDRFVGEAKSVFEWYFTEIPLTLKQLRRPLRVVYGLAIVAGLVSYLWVVIEAPSYLHITQAQIAELRTSIAENPVSLNTLGDQLPTAPVLFYYNTRTTVVCPSAWIGFFRYTGFDGVYCEYCPGGWTTGRGTVGWLFPLAGICRWHSASWDF